MKKLILCATAAVAMAGVGSTFAQSAECAVGMFGAYQGAPCTDNPSYNPNYHGNADPRQSYDYRNYGPGGVLLSQIYGDNAYPYGRYQQPRVVPRYPVTRRDRDGDGVRNRDDRRPNDPRYR